MRYISTSGGDDCKYKQEAVLKNTIKIYQKKKTNKINSLERISLVSIQYAQKNHSRNFESSPFLRFVFEGVNSILHWS